VMEPAEKAKEAEWNEGGRERRHEAIDLANEGWPACHSGQGFTGWEGPSTWRSFSKLSLNRCSKWLCSLGELGYPLHSRHLVQVLAENIYHQQYHHHKVVNNSSYNLGLIMPSSLMIMGSDKYLWSHVDLRTDPIHS
jgi:hypothetical protein